MKCVLIGVIGLVWISNIACAAMLKDLDILGATASEDKIEMKLQTRNGERTTFFYVDIMRDDPAAFVKIAQMVQKLLHRHAYRLDANIKSFSAAPSGSVYRSDSVTFYGSEGTVQ